MRSRFLGAAIAAPLLLALALAGCAKGNKGNGVASAGGPNGASAAPTPSSTLSPQELAFKFAACMRDNGVQMEDPEVDGEGHVSIKIGAPGQEIDRAKMDAAQEKCKQYSPMGGNLSNGQPDPQMEENARKMAQCMRDNGVENFPDPEGGGIRIDGSIADDPDFEKAQKACEKLMPGMEEGLVIEATSTTASTPHRRKRRRGRQIAGAAVTVAALGAAVTAAVGFGAGGTTPAAATLPPNTAQVTKQTLLDTQSEDGDLGYGDTTTLANRLPGTVTSLPISGAVFARGKTLYKVDNKPVMLLYGSVPAYRDLSRASKGADVKQLETNLKAMGYTGFTVDTKFDSGTATAVKDWQDDHGLDQTGRVELGRVVFAPAAIRIGEVKAGLGQPAQPGSEAFTYTGTTRLVTVELSVADQRLARKGAKVKVSLPGGQNVDGLVQSVSTVIEASSEPDGSPQTKIKAIVSLSDPKAADGLDAASVGVVFTAAEHKDVLTVPVAALVALSEGGYGVEVVDGSASRYVRVETGLFASGRVEVSGEGIADGTTVGMPR